MTARAAATQARDSTCTDNDLTRLTNLLQVITHLILDVCRPVLRNVQFILKVLLRSLLPDNIQDNINVIVKCLFLVSVCLFSRQVTSSSQSS